MIVTRSREKRMFAGEMTEEIGCMLVKKRKEDREGR
jgi:hypothetical protein